MASNPVRLCFKLGGQTRSFLTPRNPVFDIRCATITGKTKRGDEVIPEYKRPKPWPYKRKGYSNWTAFIDYTTKRIGENSKVIAVEGPPCIGKTEVAKALAEELEMHLIPSPTMDDYYINPYGYDLRLLDPKLPARLRSFDMNAFHKNPNHARAGWLQFIMYYMKVFRYMDGLAHVLNTGQGVIIENTVYSDLAYMEAMYAAGYATRPERIGYHKWRDVTLPELMKPHLVVYLDASPATVLENLKRRGKGEENAMNMQFLEAMDKNLKHQYLTTINEHAEVLVYDWNKPGDGEIIVEDIERIDFERFDVADHIDPKMGDWKMPEEWDWNEKRWQFTQPNERQKFYCNMMQVFLEGCKNVYLQPEDVKFMDDIMEAEVPGGKYAVGYNPQLGDSVLFKTKIYQFGLWDWKPKSKSPKSEAAT